MSTCQEQEERLTLYAAGALEPDEQARLRAHLESCPACQREVESSSRLLSQVALPPASPAVREKLEALPQRTLGAWRREQVRQAFRARTAGALLAAAAVVLVVVRPSLPRPETASPSTVPVAASAISETQADFEQWAYADPLGDLLEPDGEDDLDDSGELAEPASSESELDLNLDPGDTL